MAEELGFAGLVRVMEERLGPFGRPLTTVLIVVVVLGIFVWVGKLVHSEAVVPIVNAFDGGLPPQFGRFLAIYGIMFSVFLVASLVVNHLVTRRIRRFRKHIGDHMSEENAEHQFQSVWKAHPCTRLHRSSDEQRDEAPLHDSMLTLRNK